MQSEIMRSAVGGRSSYMGCCWLNLSSMRLQVPAQAAAAAALAEAGASGFLSPGGAGALREALASEKVLQADLPSRLLQHTCNLIK